VTAPTRRSAQEAARGTGVGWRGWSLPVWVGAVGLLVLVGVLGVVAMTVPGVADWDRAGVEAVARLRTDSLTPVMRTVTFLASAPVMLTGVALAAGVLAVRTHRLSGAVRLVLVVAVGWASVMALKPVFGRERPSVAMADVLQVEPLVAEPVGASYPSGHTALATGLALALVWACRYAPAVTRWAVTAGGVLLVLVVGLSRVYLGVHYPTDVVGAVMTVGATTLLLTGLLRGPLRARQPAAGGQAAGSAMLGS
jgi:membrane-associated phospholipid phosphatase